MTADRSRAKRQRASDENIVPYQPTSNSKNNLSDGTIPVSTIQYVNVNAPQPSSLFGKKEKTFFQNYFKTLNSFLPIVTDDFISHLEKEMILVSEATQARSQVSCASNALLWGTVAVGALLEGDRSALEYVTRCQHFFKHCFDFPSIETLRVHIVLCVFWGQLGDNKKQKRYYNFAEPIVHELNNVPTSLLSCLDFVKTMIGCEELHAGTPLSMQQLLEKKLVSEANFKLVEVDKSDKSLAHARVLNAVNFAMKCLWSNKHCSSKLLQDVKCALDDALDELNEVNANKLMENKMGAVVVRGLLGNFHLIQGNSHEALKHLINIASLIRPKPKNCLLPASWHACQITAHMLHRFEFKREYNQLSDSMRSIQAKLPFMENIAHCLFWPVTPGPAYAPETHAAAMRADF
eukprot:CAMPEP_0171452674 /NCGR_PEP_ID=MMETSP0945-20130129/687_1 /TAXON_ID=109269 /ORGANISM="Vaucheria litorea, Strain CCMP2940" /LENGTH=405 /DNA_ID=CAMNT_0011977387 /DNA_START=143 /DNA_END=1361 /DNA_ORIENTATION=+